MTNIFLHGSIDLSRAKESGQIKQIGNKFYLNVAVGTNKEPKTFGEGDKAVTYTHHITCGRGDSKVYIGNLVEYEERPIAPVTEQQIEDSQPATELPF